MLKVVKTLAGMLLALAMVFTVFGSAGLTEAQAASGKVTKKKATSFAKKVVKANNHKKLLKNHKTVTYMNDGFITWYDKDSAYYNYGESEYVVYADDDLLFIFDGEEFVYAVDTVYKGDKYINTYSDWYDYLTPANITEDEPVSLTQDGDYLVYVGKLSKENTAMWKEQNGIVSDAEYAYSIIYVGAKTYEIAYWATYTEGNEDNPEQWTAFYYDELEPAGSKIMEKMAKRTEKYTVKATIVRDAGTKNEYRKEMEIPANSGVIVYNEGTDLKFYEDPKCTKEATSWDRQSDFTRYLKSAE